MNYETSPVSIKKRKPKKNESRSNSGVAISTTKDNSVTSSTSKDVAAENEKPSTTASKTPARRNSSLCESPQFLDVADSPEFRVGWDDGFETEKPGNKIKINETENGSKRKSKRKVLNARTLRTQRILSNTTQYNTTCQTEANDHPESDEFLAWAQSLLCGEPVVQEPLVESPKLNSSLNNTENQSSKPNAMKTPKRPLLNHSSPSSDNSNGLYRPLRRKSYTASITPGRRQQESPLAKFSNNNNIEPDKDDLNDLFNDSLNELMIKCSQAVESKLNANETKQKGNESKLNANETKQKGNESKFNTNETEQKGNDSLNVSNLLDDSANDLILACTQQVEDKLFKQNVRDERGRNSVNAFDAINNANRSNNTPNKSKVQARKQENNANMDNKASVSVNTRRQGSNLHKLDCPNAIEFDSPNVISSLNEKLIATGFGQSDFRSPNPLSSKISSKQNALSFKKDSILCSIKNVTSSSKQNPLSLKKDSIPSSNENVISRSKVPEKSATKHFLSPNTKEATCSSRKRFCHNNNELAYSGNVPATSSNQDLTSILNEDEDMLCSLDMDEVLSQVPSRKPAAPIPHQKVKVPLEPTQCVPEKSARQNQGSKTLKPLQKTTEPSICFNGYKPNPVIPSKDLKLNAIRIQQTVPINGVKIQQTVPINGITIQQTGPISSGTQPNSDVKYTQEQIQMKKIEAKRRLALSKRQKSFEMK